MFIQEMEYKGKILEYRVLKVVHYLAIIGLQCLYVSCLIH